MPQFTLNWNASEVVSNANATGQRASYRRKDVGGAWITAAWTPANDLPKAAVTALSPNLLANVLYEFKVDALCAVGGPTTNSNGIIEALKFECIAPTVTKSDTTGTISINGAGLNLLKARFTLRKASDNTIVDVQTTVNFVANVATTTKTGLTPATSYYWQVELYAVVGGVERLSSSASYLNAVCGSNTAPYSFTTDAATSCAAPVSLVIS